MRPMNSQRMPREGAARNSWLDLPEMMPGTAGFDMGAALEKEPAFGPGGCGQVLFEKSGSLEEILRELKENGYSSMVFPNFNYELGLACFQLSLIDEAIELFRIAIETDENPAKATHYLALCYREKGFLGEAQKYLHRARELGEEADVEIMELEEAVLPAEGIRAESEPAEFFAVDTLTPADLELQKLLAPYRACLKLPQGYAA